MPRINAATLAEHREQQRRVILDAARGLLAEDSDQAPSLAEVGRRAGLARTSLYQYFSSREDLLDAVIADVFPQWQARLREAMARADGPVVKARAYVRVNLTLVAEGEHAVVRGLATHARDRVTGAHRELHEQVVRPMIDALGGSEERAELVQSVIWSASMMIERGHPLGEVADHVEALLGPFFDALDEAEK